MFEVVLSNFRPPWRYGVPDFVPTATGCNTYYIGHRPQLCEFLAGPHNPPSQATYNYTVTLVFCWLLIFCPAKSAHCMLTYMGAGVCGCISTREKVYLTDAPQLDSTIITSTGKFGRAYRREVNRPSPLFMFTILRNFLTCASIP
jgi:hypothetical protein